MNHSLPISLKQLQTWTEDHPKALGSPHPDGSVGNLALPSGQWHRTPTTQETDGFQVKRPGDLSVRCTLLLMLDYQVGFTPSLQAIHRACLLTFSRSTWPRTLTSTPEPYFSLQSHLPGDLFLASPVQTGPPLSQAAGIAYTEPLSHCPGTVAVCEDQQATGLP